MDALAPFSLNLFSDVGAMLGYDFMRHALIVGGAIGLSAGLVGYFVVLRNQVFTSDALGHVAFTGGLGGALLGLPLLGSVFASTIAAALGIGSLGGRARGRDVAIGTVFAWVLGVGALFNSLYTGGRSGTSGVVGVRVLFGSLLSLQPSQAGGVAIIAIVIGVGLLLIARPLLFVSVDPDVAQTRGVPVGWVTAVFLVLIGATVAESVQAVGALLIFGLLVTPAAVAQNLTARPYLGMLLSAVLSVAFVWVGLGLGFYLPYPASFFITATAFAVYLGSVIYARARRPSRVRTERPPLLPSTP